MKTISVLTLALFISCGQGGANKDSGAHNSNQNQQLASEGAKPRASFRFDHVFKSFENKQTKVKASDDRYATLAIKRHPKKKELNHQVFDKGLRTVHLTGIEIELGGNNSHVAYDLLEKTFDVERLVIEARTLVIHSPIHVAQAHVEIMAETVKFVGNGKIITTPASREDRARLKENGLEGLKAGPITISAKEIISKEGAPVLLAIGGDGQPAGPGVDGARGKNAKIVKGGNYYYWKYRKLHSYGGREGGRDYRSYKKEGRRSTNGANAQVGGMPGHGGQGGAINLSALKVEGVVADISGGEHGAKDIVRKGGAPGSPAKTCRLEYKKRKGCKTAKKGKDAAPLEHASEKGRDGEYSVKVETTPLPIKVAFLLNEYAKDLYLSRHLQDAREVFKYIEAEFENKELQTPHGLNALETARANLDSLDMRLDYFGNERTWVPSLSFTAASQAFRKEGAKSLKLFMLTEELMREGASIQERREALVELRSELLEQNRSSSQRITHSVEEDARLRKSIADLDVAEEEFRTELKRVEREIKKMAKRNLAVPGWKKTLGVVSALSKTIPVGQPTFGAVGLGLDLVTKGLEGKYGAGDLINDAPSIANSFKGFDWKGATSELDGKLKELNPKDFMGLPSHKEKLEYLKKVVDFARPMASEIKGQLATWKERETSRSSLDAEIQKIKRGHKVYKGLVAKLEKVLAKKSDFYKLARALNQTALRELESIQNNFLTIAYAFDDGELFDAQELLLGLKALKHQTQRRMKRYSYTMVKAYEYQYLRSFPLGGDLKGFFSKATKLIGQDGPYAERAEKLETLFEGEVSSLTESIILGTKKRDELVKFVKLSHGEVNALNSGETIYLDFTDLSFFGVDKENIRLHKVEVDERSLFDGDQFEMNFKHVGSGMVKNAGDFYFFTHDRPDVWVSSAQYGEIYHSSPSEEAGEGIAASLELDFGTQVFSRPSGRSFIKTELKSPGADLIEVYVRVHYSFEYALDKLK